MSPADAIYALLPIEMTQPLLNINDLHTHFFLDEGVVRAVNGVNLEIPAGRTLAIIGESQIGRSNWDSGLVERVAVRVVGEVRSAAGDTGGERVKDRPVIDARASGGARPPDGRRPHFSQGRTVLAEPRGRSRRQCSNSDAPDTPHQAHHTVHRPGISHSSVALRHVRSH